LHVIKLSIHPSRVGIVAGSDVGDSLDGSGVLLASSILVSILFLLCCGDQDVSLLVGSFGSMTTTGARWVSGRAVAETLEGVEYRRAWFDDT
jgi:hypothetical protein